VIFTTGFVCFWGGFEADFAFSRVHFVKTTLLYSWVECVCWSPLMAASWRFGSRGWLTALQQFAKLGAVGGLKGCAPFGLRWFADLG